MLDQYKVSLKAYHELAQIAPMLPRMNHLEQLQKNFGEQFNVFLIAGNVLGALCSLIEELKKDIRLKKYGEETLKS